MLLATKGKTFSFNPAHVISVKAEGETLTVTTVGGGIDLLPIGQKIAADKERMDGLMEGIDSLLDPSVPQPVTRGDRVQLRD